MTQIPTEEELNQTILDAKLKWIEKNGSKEQIEKLVFTRFNKDIIDTIAKIIGFDNRWGGDNKWEVDHCNGRSGNSFIGEHIKSFCTEIIVKWFEKNRTTWTKIPKKEVEALRKAYYVEYKNTLKDRLYRLAREHGEEDARRMIQEMIEKK